MNISPESTVGQIVVDHPESSDVFENCGIDFCCNGNKTLAKACTEKGISFEALRALLEEKQEARKHSENGGHNNEPDFKYWPLDLLADYIEKKHHRYVAENLLILSRYLEKIKAVHGQTHPEIFQIADIFRESAGELAKHMKKEELILFPFIRKLVKMKTRESISEIIPRPERYNNPSA
ncbi:DUF542 domain-containing protein [Anseongella ginsenosidimutans]|uniref:DUF542 domain-containing protein n=1 Tax=Anseongella ginsenosidimutans TaxID=496056 RepID=UPI0021D0C3F2|nr:DUF542 domain-containing protein [Anseongella ginsenosidimutans]